MSISYNAGASQPNPFGQIQRAGMMPNGRAVYRVVDGQGQEAGRISIPQQNIGQFEQAYRDIMETAPKLQKYQIEMSNPDNVKKKKITMMSISAFLTLVGGSLGYYFTKNKTTWKKALGTTGGIVAGIAAGIGTSITMAMPSGIKKFQKATETMSKIDVQPLNVNG